MTDTPMAGEQVIPLEPVVRKLAERYQLLTHVAVAVSLVQEAVPAIRSNPGSEWFAWIELIAATALIVAAVRELKGAKSERHESIAWTEIAAGVVLLVEASLKWREGPRHYPLAIARALAAALVMSLGFYHTKLRHAMSLRIDDTGVRWRRGWFISAHANWADLEGVSVEDRVVKFLSRNGDGPLLRLARIKNREAIATAIASAATQKGIPVTGKRLPR
jgi:hypothetical protein